MDIFIIVVIWCVISLLCVETLNKENDKDNDWNTISKWEKLIYTSISPIMFIYLRVKEAIEK